MGASHVLIKFIVFMRLWYWINSSQYSLDDWVTTVHDPGYCAMSGICGKRADGDVLNCALNTKAASPTLELGQALQSTCPQLWAEQKGPEGQYCCSADQVKNIASSTMKVAPFVLGCPACHHNFIHFWCVINCSPDQATFTNISTAQQAYDTNATVVAEVDYWVDPMFGERFFNSCKDVKFGAANVPAMNFIGGGATNYQAWFEFLGLLKDKRAVPVGSPFQQNFHTSAAPEMGGDGRPAGFSGALNGSMASCGDNALRCSCSDCPTGGGCQLPPDDGGDEDDQGICHVGAISCFEFTMIFLYAGAVALLVRAYHPPKHKTGAPPTLGPEEVDQQLPDLASQGKGSSSNGAMLLQQQRNRQRKVQEGQGGSEVGVDEYSLLSDAIGSEDFHPVVERWLQELYYRLGLLCAKRPWQVLGSSVAVVALCCLGFIWFKIETDPQMLWVGPASQAARDRAAYEASFGPFYRITQMIFTTTAETQSPYRTLTGRPAIVTRAIIEGLFDIQAEIDAVSASVGPDGQVAKLTDVCYKPFGDVCATQSVLQYWQMDKQMFQKQQAAGGRMRPEYCFSRWFTECRSAFQAPMDPHVVLGGFPSDASSFRNYSSDTTAFVVTMPLSSRQENLPAARAWEAALISLLSDKDGAVQNLVKGLNLSMSFSTERSVQDELERESASDAATVAVSYLAMLVYISLALGTVPSFNQPLQALVSSRVGLGLGGVLIVALSVAGALGLVSALGLWSTLIIMEVIPFLVLAVGVDNMFVLAHALQRQAPGPLSERIASALSSSGPSITLAAACEVVAFGLGYFLTPMPAVRNFSLCACLAVLLDFGLQVTAFVCLLTLDTARMEAGRLDLVPCVTLPPPRKKHGSILGGVFGGMSAAMRFRSYGGVDPSIDAELNQEPLLNDALSKSAAKSTLQQGLQWYMQNVHIPMLLNKRVQAAVLLTFITGLCLSIVAVPHISVGLDQAVALPRDSYLQSYYKDVLQDLRVGPPLLVVVNNLNVSRASSDIDRVCSVSGCRPNSLLNQISLASQSPRRTRIATPAASWVDDFISWLSPSLPKCCRQHSVAPPDTYPPLTPAPMPNSSPPSPSDPSLPSLPPPELSPQQLLPPTPVSPSSPIPVDDSPPLPLPPLSEAPAIPPSVPAQMNMTASVSLHGILAAGLGSSAMVRHPKLEGYWSQKPSSGYSPEETTYCPPPDQPPCSTAPSSCSNCEVCVALDFEGGRPSLKQFQQYLPWFMSAVPSEQCAKGGAGPYSDALEREVENGNIRGLPEGIVAASAFRAYYTPLSKQQDFISAVKSTRNLIATLKSSLDLDVYAYSMFHVFFEQYLTIYTDGALLVGMPLLSILIVSWILTSNLWGSLMLVLVLGSLLIHLLGAMLVAGIQLNAVSLVNLAMALGIAVEFCAHIVHAFGVASGSRTERMVASLQKSGASVISGITLTKLVGVAVLAFAQTQIFEVYYFRLYFALVALGVAHGLVLLPLLLLFFGPQA